MAIEHNLGASYDQLTHNPDPAGDLEMSFPNKARELN